MYITTVIIRKEIYIMLLFSDNSKPPERMGRKAKGPKYSVQAASYRRRSFFVGKNFSGIFREYIVDSSLLIEKQEKKLL